MQVLEKKTKTNIDFIYLFYFEIMNKFRNFELNKRQYSLKTFKFNFMLNLLKKGELL